MKHVKRFSDDEVRMILCTDIHRGSKISKVALFVSVLSLVWIVPAIGDDTVYTIDTIAEGLLGAEAQFTDLRLDYNDQRCVYRDGNSICPFRIVKAVYAQKVSKQDPNDPNKPKKLRYLDRKSYLIDQNTKQITLVEDTLSTFNGKGTTVLNRKAKRGKLMRAVILEGYDPNQFPAYDMDPHTKIWYCGKKIGRILKENRKTFRTESEAELLDGVSTIKLTGTFADGKITMKLWISPERNFLPLKRQISKTGGRLLSETALYELVQLPNGMWYPKIIRSPDEPPGAPNPRMTQVYNISKISIEPITEEFFSPEFSPGTYVIDDINKVSYTTY